MASPLRGADGNREFLAHGRKPGPGVTRVDGAALDALADVDPSAEIDDDIDVDGDPA